jgi:hypothetical protein
MAGVLRDVVLEQSMTRFDPVGAADEVYRGEAVDEGVGTRD